MIQDVFLEVSKLLRDYGGPVYSVEAKHLVELHEYSVSGKFFENDIQKQEVYSGLTTVALCQVARAAIYGDLEMFSGGPENDLTRFFHQHQVSSELQRHLDDEMPSGDITVEILERLEGDAWQRVSNATMTPKSLSWMRVREHVDAAMGDPAVAANPEAVAFLDRMGELLKVATGGMLLADVLKPMHSAISKQIRGKRTAATSGKVKARALALYDAGVWPSTAEAARKIYPELHAYAASIEKAKYPSKDRFAQTLSEWLNQRKKNTANS
jgi:hypothetical protein